MTPQERKVIELALEALEKSQQILNEYMTECVTARQANNEAITAMKELLAQPEQEPVAWIEQEWSGSGLRHLHFERREPTVRDEVMNPVWTPLYTTPPQRTEQEPVAFKCGDATVYIKPPVYGTPPPQRKPLTDEEMDAVIDGCPKYHGRFSTKDPDGKLNYYELIRATEAAHGIKE